MGFMAGTLDEVQHDVDPDDDGADRRGDAQRAPFDARAPVVHRIQTVPQVVKSGDDGTVLHFRDLAGDEASRLIPQLLADRVHAFQTGAKGRFGFLDGPSGGEVLAVVRDGVRLVLAVVIRDPEFQFASDGAIGVAHLGKGTPSRLGRDGSGGL